MKASMTLEVILGVALDGPSVTERVDRDSRVGTLVVGPTGFLHDFEHRLGLHGEAALEETRVECYAHRLEAVARTHGGRLFWSEVYAKDAHETARNLLTWRDALVLGGWNGGPIVNGSARLEALAWIEAIGATIDHPDVPALPPGVADRWIAVVAELDAGALVPYSRVQVVDPLTQLSARAREVLHAITRQGVFVAQTPIAEAPPSAQTDLGRMQHHLRHGGASPWLEGDGTLVVVEGAQAELDAVVETVVSKHEHVVVIGGARPGPHLEHVEDAAAVLHPRELVVVAPAVARETVPPGPWTDRERSALRAVSVELLDEPRQREAHAQATRRMLRLATEKLVILRCEGGAPDALLDELAVRAGGSLRAVTRPAATVIEPTLPRAAATAVEPELAWSLEVHELGGALSLTGDRAARRRIGEAVRSFFAADPIDGDVARRIAMAQRILDRRGLHELAAAEALVEAHERLRAWVRAARPDGTWRRGVPVNARTQPGAIDLLVSSSRGALVIDHSAIEDREEAVEHARGQAARLGTWAGLVGGIGMLHLPVPGCVVTLGPL